MKKLFYLSLGVVVAFAFLFAGQADAQQKFSWKLQSCWVAGDFHVTNARGMADKVEAMSGGRLKIEVLGAGAIVPAFEVLDAVHKGILDAGHGWPGYWLGKSPAATLFGSVAGGPFGMNSEDFLGWYYTGGGKELYNEMLQQDLKLNVLAFATFGETPEPQGWFNKPVKTVKDFKGLKFRAGGMSAEVFKAMGMTVITLPSGEVVPGLQKGIIDAAEWSDPSSDLSAGFMDVRKFYHLPGLHQPTGMMELQINKKKWEELPADLKAIVEYACMAEALHFTVRMLNQNSIDLTTLIDKHGVKVIETPKEILIEVLQAWDKVAAKYCKENAFFNKVYESQKSFAARVVPYRRIGHPSYDMAADYYWGKINPYRVQKP